MLAVIELASIGACDESTAPPDGPASPWSSLALPDGRRRLEPAVTASGTRLVIAGGYATGMTEGLQISNEVLVYDTLADAWSTLPPLPVTRHHGALAASAGVLFALGGLEDTSNTPSGRAFALELDGTEWIELPAMPAGQERGGAGVMVYPPHIYLLGGSNATGPLKTCLDFDIATRTWGTCPDLPTARSHPAVMRDVEGDLILVGGLDDANRPLGDVWRLRPGAELWEPRSAMVPSRGGCAFGVVFGSLLCAGGEAGASALDVTQRYDPITDQWLDLTPMPVPRAGAQGAVIGGKLYVVGGAERIAFEPTDSVLVFSYVDAVR